MSQLVVHGGAGAPPEGGAGPRQTSVERAADLGWERIGGGALAAVLAAVRWLEDDPLFDAGIGSALTADGTVEMDAAVMLGADLTVGAVAAVHDLRHPVDGAVAVLRDGRHVLLVGEGASRFAAAAGVEQADPSSFVVPLRVAQLHDHDTVGAVARDAEGHLAVAVSTGGITAKAPGRVGDSPIVGAGFYADDRLGAACATGHGEDFLRTVASYAAAVAMPQLGAQASLEHTLATLGRRVDGSGGLIGIDVRGEIGAAYNTVFMPWAQRSS